jgi:hypothetical protein
MNDEPSQDLIEVRLRSAAQFAPVRVLEDHYERDEKGRRRLVGGSSVPIRIVMVEAAEELERLRAAVNALPELPEMLAKVKRLEEALKPFAAVGGRVSADTNDERHIWPIGGITAGDFRRARAALKETKA